MRTDQVEVNIPTGTLKMHHPGAGAHPSHELPGHLLQSKGSCSFSDPTSNFRQKSKTCVEGPCEEASCAMVSNTEQKLQDIEPNQFVKEETKVRASAVLSRTGDLSHHAQKPSEQRTKETW